MASASPRVQQARLRAADAKRALLVVSAAGFVGVFALARATHPGHSTAQPATPSVTSVPRSSSDDADSSLSFGSGSIAPSQNVAPSVQTSTS